jgi:hypothetical protein
LIKGEFIPRNGHEVIIKKNFLREIKDFVLKQNTDLLNQIDFKLVSYDANDNTEVKSILLTNGKISKYISAFTNEEEFNIFLVLPCQKVKYLIGTSDVSKDVYCDYIQSGDIKTKQECVNKLAELVNLIIANLSP